MKDVIITCSDAKFGDFLIDHWLKSLKENVDLKNIDVVILDYGLTNEQIFRLKKEKTILLKCGGDEHIHLIRFRDMYNFLKNKKYNQVLSIDGGDTIFQTDLKEIFSKDKNYFRVSLEEFNIIKFNEIFANKYFNKKLSEEINKVLKNKKMINAGVVFAPAKKFGKFSREVYNLPKNKIEFGPDQVSVNFLLNKQGFKVLEEKYNFIPTTTKSSFYIKNGEFYFKNGKKIPIVHNAGNISFLRPIKNFGYGTNFNKINILSFYSLRIMGRIRSLFKK